MNSVVLAFRKNPKTFVFGSLGGKRGGLWRESDRRRPVPSRPALTRRPAERRPAPTRPWHVRVLGPINLV